MKKIEAIIRPDRLDKVHQALEQAGCTGLMVTEIEGCGKQRGLVHQWRGEKYRVTLVPKVKLEVIVKDGDLGRITALIIDNARTGEIGDGKIFIYDLCNAIRIRTKEEGEVVL